MNDRLENQIEELLIRHKTAVKETVERLLTSGMIDVRDYQNKDSLLAKVLVTAASREVVNMFEPPNGVCSADLENLKYG